MIPKAYYWGGVASAFMIGVITGVAGVRTDLERKLRKEYQQRERALQNSYQRALELAIEPKEVPEKEELNLDENLDEAIEGLDAQFEDKSNEILTAGGEIETVNPYHKAVEVSATPHQLFVDGGVNDYGVSYIDEEDYQDEDGRFKGKIDLIMDDHNPVFLMDGQPIDDWDRRIGDSILVDFYKLVPPGADPILYVRNHRTDEDYEVVRISP